MAKAYVVRAVLAGTVEVAEHGFTFGPFDNRDSAEECVIALSTRPDVRGAMIDETTEQKRR